MRKCRKMISWIMLTVMLATVTPYQAHATEVPADSSVQEVQPADGEEGQEQRQDTEGTIPEGQKDPEENEKTTLTDKNSLAGTYFDLADTSKWSTDAPEDLSTVTAVVIDNSSCGKR